MIPPPHSSNAEYVRDPIPSSIGGGETGVVVKTITGKKVQITEVPLHEYLAKNGRQTGIIVARVNEVV